MTDRDRLIELIKAGIYGNIDDGFDGPVLNCENVADYLLANGVIVPPCKVGDKLYITASISKEIVETVVIGMWIIEDSFSILTIHGTIINNSLGDTVFLTKEEAEEKLKELG